jgi:hypothetical protein
MSKIILWIREVRREEKKSREGEGNSIHESVK